MLSLQERCYSEIAQKPERALTAPKVEQALFSKRARQMVRRSTEIGAASGGGSGIDTVRVRQRIITKLIDEGRGMAGSFPAPPAFLDESFTSVSLANSKIGDPFMLDTLSKQCPMLQNVDLTACFYIRDVSIEVLLQRCPLIQHLSIRNCRKLTDQSLEHVVRDGKKIVALDMGGCFNLTAPGVDSLCTIHPNASIFTDLDISGIAVTTHTLELICKHCRNLESLRMGFIEYMEETLTHTLPPLVPKLRSFHVHWNTCITDAFLSWAVTSMPRLQDINLCGCSHVSAEGVSEMLYARQETLSKDRTGDVRAMQSINLRYTLVTKQDIETLQSAFRGISIR